MARLESLDQEQMLAEKLRDKALLSLAELGVSPMFRLDAHLKRLIQVNPEISEEDIVRAFMPY